MEKCAGLVKKIASRFVDPQIALQAGDEITGKVRRDLLDLAYRNNWANILVNLAAAGGLVIILGLLGDLVAITVWWSVILAVLCAVRLWGGYLYHRERAKVAELDADAFHIWQRRYALGVLSAAILWAVIGIIEIPIVRGESQFMTLIMFAGLAGGATGILAPIFLVGRLYLTALLFPPVIIFTVMADANYVLAIMTIIFLMVMLITHRNNHVVLFRSLVLKHRNDGLVEDLRQKNRIMENWNATLEARVEERTEELRNLVEHDALTGILNRDGIAAWFNQKRQSSDDLDYAVLFIDLDRFKQINDGLSHAIGDEVLRIVSDRLKAYVDDQHAVGRWGGDEFLMVLAAPHDELHGLVENTIEKARASISQPIMICGHSLHVGFSTGVAFAAAKNPGISELIHWADLAAAEVKRSGRGSVRNYDKTLLTEQERRLAINQALRRALGTGEFYLEYQPVIDADDGQIVSYEALLRWNSNELGLVPPDEFIPIAEESALIVEIGEWCMRTACREICAATDGDDETKIAVNVSIRQLVAPGFTEMVAQILSETGLVPTRLILEVTESIFEERQRSMISRVIDDLFDMGIGIHIDDFGTGYSSLSRLHQIQIDAVKIDKSFILEMDENARVVIEGAILIAHRFGLQVIAEGVETDQQRNLLQSLGVDAYQGYFFARPGALPCLDCHWQVEDTPPLKSLSDR
ncbi:putative bifunctional diguanylate cyclase/phosphodiesterase [Thalassospira povalilytica]|uniref:Bifunctional diguanylate cyclase/phosphodiesterase n=1 Tax=Thalassospira povalilytica TaxID=732237 RepID=A0A8I1MAC6_9PROT|nr:bifunctional diguanylate cyclase/phosphodiesterase [Thalassospira povalilytica]MBN8198350.1 bifunctional diguanylate cyclase/phosphodiesterase [Thalassospira povalilytica]